MKELSKLSWKLTESRRWHSVVRLLLSNGTEKQKAVIFNFLKNILAIKGCQKWTKP